MRTSTTALLLWCLSVSAAGEELFFPASQTSYTHPGPGEVCATGYAIDADGDESAPSATSCGPSPRTVEWIAPTQNVDGTSLTDLAQYRFVFTVAAPPPPPPSEITSLIVGPWIAIPVVAMPDPTYVTGGFVSDPSEHELTFTHGGSEGDLVAVLVNQNIDAETFSVSGQTGWTIVNTDLVGSNSIGMLLKVLGASEPSTFTIVSSSGVAAQDSMGLAFQTHRPATGYEFVIGATATGSTGSNAVNLIGTAVNGVTIPDETLSIIGIGKDWRSSPAEDYTLADNSYTNVEGRTEDQIAAIASRYYDVSEGITTAFDVEIEPGDNSDGLSDLSESVHVIVEHNSTSAGGDVTAQGDMSFGSSADLSATGALSAQGDMAFGSSADLGGALIDLVAQGDLAFGSSADLSGAGTLSAQGAVTFGSSATLNGLGALSAQGTVSFGSAADLTAAAANDISAAGALSFGSVAALTGVADLNAAGAQVFGSSADLSAIGQLSATGPVTFGSTANLTAATNNDMLAQGSLSFGSAAALNAIGELNAVGAQVFGSAASLTQATTVTLELLYEMLLEIQTRLDLVESVRNTYALDNSYIDNSSFRLERVDNGDGTFDVVKTDK